MSGTGFVPGASLKVRYSGVPAAPPTIDAGSTTVLPDTRFSIIIPGHFPGQGICSDSQLGANVTVTASDGTNTLSGTLPTYLWCSNAITQGASINGGCK